MKGKVIIDDNGSVTVPSEVRMTIAEIADLFGIFYQTTKGIVRTIEKSGVADGDYSMCCTVEGSKVSPEYYGFGNGYRHCVSGAVTTGRGVEVGNYKELKVLQTADISES